jgi:hypothetical protein
MLLMVALSLVPDRENGESGRSSGEARRGI